MLKQYNFCLLHVELNQLAAFLVDLDHLFYLGKTSLDVILLQQIHEDLLLL